MCETVGIYTQVCFEMRKKGTMLRPPVENQNCYCILAHAKTSLFMLDFERVQIYTFETWDNFATSKVLDKCYYPIRKCISTLII